MRSLGRRGRQFRLLGAGCECMIPVLGLGSRRIEGTILRGGIGGGRTFRLEGTL